MLSITGIFGLAAYSVSKRLRELGIRIALGAQRKEVLKAALGKAFRLLAFGSLAGLFLGQVVSFTEMFAPTMGGISIYMAMAVVLLVRPTGLLGEAGFNE